MAGAASSGTSASSVLIKALVVSSAVFSSASARLFVTDALLSSFWPLVHPAQAIKTAKATQRFILLCRAFHQVFGRVGGKIEQDRPSIDVLRQLRRSNLVERVFGRVVEIEIAGAVLVQIRRRDARGDQLFNIGPVARRLFPCRYAKWGKRRRQPRAERFGRIRQFDVEAPYPVCPEIRLCCKRMFFAFMRGKIGITAKAANFFRTPPDDADCAARRRTISTTRCGRWVRISRSRF